MLMTLFEILNTRCFSNTAFGTVSRCTVPRTLVQLKQHKFGVGSFFGFTKLNFAAAAELNMCETAQCKLNTGTHGNMM